MLIIIIIIAGILLDQLTKIYFASILEPGESITVIKNVLNFTYVENKGAAFGMLDGARYFFIAVTVLTCAALGWWLIKNKNKTHKLMGISCAMIISGGIGNLIDRIFLGSVRDFIEFNINFAIFNVADSFVTVGAILLGVYILFIHDKYVQQLKDEAAADAEQDKNSD